MGKMYVAKDVIDQIVKNAPRIAKKYAPHIVTGTVGAGIGLVVGKADKKNAMEKSFKNGVSAASEIYEKKFRLQTDAFLKKEKSYENNKKEYDKLIKEYEKEIIKLENKVQKTEEEVNELRVLLNKKNELLHLKIAV